ncbi:MAG: Holliday junction resolvase RuvX [Ignavibacteriaceae bacterium]|nr:Holliday junction resolvase RuvX [Ignavibacteriaceae bacterium]MCW8816733.1 Holliday junction resolvase RuvX [Ignavibacteriaceae bacterium]
MEQSAIEFRIMGIDFGEKRIGIALSDPLLTFAYPFTTIQNDSSFFSKLTAIIIEKKIKKIILGLPSSSYKSSKELTIKVLKLKTDIESKNKIDVILWDEEYSSAIAKERVVESVTKKSKRKKKELLDQHSAAVILQEYLDSK